MKLRSGYNSIGLLSVFGVYFPFFMIKVIGLRCDAFLYKHLFLVFFFTIHVFVEKLTSIASVRKIEKKCIDVLHESL